MVLRRVPAMMADPLELRGNSGVGVPGLIEATRQGQVSVANPIGAGALENPALLSVLPGLGPAFRHNEPYMRRLWRQH